jgi:sugar phosphate isomerase/epimerase
MNESIKKFMQVGIVHFMAYPSTIRGEGPILETVRKIVVDDYFDAIEVTWIKDSETRIKVGEMARTAGVTLAYGGQPRLLTTGLNLNSLDEKVRSDALISMKEGIDEAYELGAAGFAFLSGKYEEETKEQAFELLVASTRELCAYARSKGDMKVVLEVFDYDIDKKSLIGPVALAKRFAETIRKEYDNFGLMVDLSHIPQLHETIEESILPIRDYIVHAHIGNCVIKDPAMPAYGDIHPRFGFENSENGVEEIVQFLKVLINIGLISEEKRPIVSFEVKPWGDEDPDLVVANAKRALNLAWSKL